MGLNRSGYLPTYDGCYVCGQKHPRGLRARFFADGSGQVQCRFQPEPTQTGYDGVVHGGVISALLDELVGWPITLQTGRMCVTAEITVRFVRPVSVDRTYLAVASPGTDRGRLWENTGDLRDEAGVVYARAHGKYILLSEEQTKAAADKLTYQPDDLPVLREKAVLSQ